MTPSSKKRDVELALNVQQMYIACRQNSDGQLQGDSNIPPTREI